MSDSQLGLRQFFLVIITRMERQLPYSVTISLAPPKDQANYITIIGRALSVDRQIDQKNVEKTITTSQEGVKVRISANQLKLLRACITGFLRHMRLVAETIAQFKDDQ